MTSGRPSYHCDGTTTSSALAIRSLTWPSSTHPTNRTAVFLATTFHEGPKWAIASDDQRHPRRYTAPRIEERRHSFDIDEPASKDDKPSPSTAGAGRSPDPSTEFGLTSDSLGGKAVADKQTPGKRRQRQISAHVVVERPYGAVQTEAQGQRDEWLPDCCDNSDAAHQTV